MKLVSLVFTTLALAFSLCALSISVSFDRRMGDRENQIVDSVTKRVENRVRSFSMDHEQTEQANDLKILKQIDEIRKKLTALEDKQRLYGFDAHYH